MQWLEDPLLGITDGMVAAALLYALRSHKHNAHFFFSLCHFFSMIWL